MIAPNPQETPPRPQLARRTLLVASIAVGVLLLALFLWYSLQVVFLIFAGILVAVLLRGLADGLSQVTGLGPGVSLAIVIVGISGLLVGVGFLAAPTLGEQFAQLGEQLPIAWHNLKGHLERSRLGGILLQNLPSADAVSEWRKQMLGSVGTVVSGAIGGVVTIAVIGFIGLYVAAEPRLYLRGILRLIPAPHRDRSAEILGAIGYTLKWWLIGQAIDMLVIGALTAVGLWLLGVPLAFLLGFLAAVFNFIPNFGPLFSLIPAMLLALTIEPSRMLWVLALYIVLQSLEGYVLMPLIQRRAVDLPGALIIASQVLLGLLVGLLGLALATPLTAAILVAAKMLYVEDTLGESIQTPADGDAAREIRDVRHAEREVSRSAEGGEQGQG